MGAQVVKRILMKQTVFYTLILLLFGCYAIAQDNSDAAQAGVFSRIFLPSVDVGYQFQNSDLIEGSLRIATSIEYRFKNNNDFFIRLSYDTYGARYNIANIGNTSNTIEGTVQVSDFFLAPGYRLGDKTFRFMISVMPGIKLYEYPIANVDGQRILISQTGNSLFTTSFLYSLEYYFDEKSALTLSMYNNRVWKEIDFWEDGRSAIGFSIGFITSLL